MRLEVKNLASNEYVLEMHGICKYFPGVKALDGVELQVRPGTVHTLMGENGAGKSTLMKCLIGMQPVTEGTIIYKGEEVHFKSVQDSIHAGITMIQQELSPVLERTVADNLWLGREPLKGGKGFAVDNKKMYKDAEDLFKQLNLDVDVRAKMKDLTVAKQQMVEIAKAVSHNASIVIMDEPTSALTDAEVEDLFRIINDLKAKNVAIIYISHKMDEIFRISDDITVFRDGQYVGTDRAANLDNEKLVKMMVGRSIDNMFPKIPCPIGDVILKVEHLSSGKAVKDVSFEVRKGEILGFAGLVGAGRTETMETIFGMRPKTGGKVYKNGEELHITCPADAIKNGIGMLTEDRRGNGIVGLGSIIDNTTIANMKAYGFPMNHKKMLEDTREFNEKIRTKTPTWQTRIMNLSGGNQQKVLLARWLLTAPDILIVDEPTRGIDVGAKSEIHELLSKLAGEGKAVIVISSEMPEVMGCSDRIVIMHEGEKTGELSREEFSQELLMRYATGGSAVEDLKNKA
ncbi:MAG: sugar ABC transporter ATP-binding protein [Lachnospiraceae bacterium]|nr:sugar ABC transporter ATP-binding protein [Lachnospiraceae bacterium]